MGALTSIFAVEPELLTRILKAPKSAVALWDPHQRDALGLALPADWAPRRQALDKSWDDVVSLLTKTNWPAARVPLEAGKRARLAKQEIELFIQLPAQVARVAAALRDVSLEDARRVCEDTEVWGEQALLRGAALDYAADFAEKVVAFFAEAARAGQGVVRRTSW
jgi:hypothetical protein